MTDEMPFKVKSVSPLAVACHALPVLVPVLKHTRGDAAYKNHTDY